MFIRKLLFLVVLVVFFLLVNQTSIHYVLGKLRQIKTPDISLTAHYQERVKTFQSLSDNNAFDVFLLGDSIFNSMGENFDSWPNTLNASINGDTAKALLSRLNKLDVPESSIVFILIGTNDIGRNASIQHVLEHVAAIINKFQTNKIVVCSVLFSNGIMRNNDKIDKVNIGLRKMTDSFSFAHYLDLNAHLAETGKLNKAFSLDGLHLNDSGINTLRSVLFQEVSKFTMYRSEIAANRRNYHP